MVGATKIRVDENEVDKLSKVKKFGVTTTNEPTKRAALGDLQNRGLVRTSIGKEAAQKDLSDLKFKNALQNAKARVDTHWKKAPTSIKAPTVQVNASSNSNVAGATAVGHRRILTRSNSSAATIGNSVAASSNGTATARNGVTLNKLKTLTTKVVETKVHQVKYVTKVAPKVGGGNVAVESKIKTAIDPTLRREDSNLSRKSLTKLKAALAKPTSNKAASSAATVSVSSSATTTVAVPAVKKDEHVTSTTSSNKLILQDPKSDIKIISVQNVQTHSSQFLDAVEDIDVEDADNLLLVSEYVNDIYAYLYQVEAEQMIRKNYLEDHAEIYPKMRSVLIDWINEVHLQFRLAAETFQMAVAIIDRYLQKAKDTKRSLFQLVGVTALFIAAKYEELYPPAITDFVYITDDTYTAKQILQMEMKMFKTIDFNLARPLPIHFLRRFSKAAKAEDVHHAMSKYFLELSAIEYDLASYKPSEIAAASLFLTLHIFKDDPNVGSGFNDSHWTATLQWYSRYSTEHLRPISRKIAAVVRNAPNTKLKAVYNKYKTSKLQKISLRSELYSPLIDSIINSEE